MPHRNIDAHVGNAIRLRRTSIGMTPQQLASGLGVPLHTVEAYEAGDRRVSASQLYEISQLLDVPVAYFFEGYVG